MQAKLVKIELKPFCESTLSFWQARAKLLIAHTFCRSSVDPRCHITDVETFFYHRRVFLGSLAISVIKKLRCERQIHRSCGGFAWITWKLCKFVVLNLHKFLMAEYSEYINHTLEINAPKENYGMSAFLSAFITF